MSDINNTSDNTICSDYLTDDDLLNQAIALSLEEQSQARKDFDKDEVKKKRLAR